MVHALKDSWNTEAENEHLITLDNNEPRRKDFESNRNATVYWIERMKMIVTSFFDFKQNIDLQKAEGLVIIVKQKVKYNPVDNAKKEVMWNKYFYAVCER